MGKVKKELKTFLVTCVVVRTYLCYKKEGYEQCRFQKRSESRTSGSHQQRYPDPQKGGNNMKHLLLILIISLFMTSTLAQKSDSSSQLYMSGGLTLNPLGSEMGFVFVPTSEKKPVLKFAGGYMSFARQDDSGSYEDYTDVLGTKNVFDDRFDGEFTISNYFGLGGYFYSPIKETKMFLISQVGAVLLRESFYYKYYDASEILGYNGKYYSESSRSDSSSLGLEIGSSFYFALTQNLLHGEYCFWYGFLGASFSTVKPVAFKGGLLLYFPT